MSATRPEPTEQRRCAGAAACHVRRPMAGPVRWSSGLAAIAAAAPPAGTGSQEGAPVPGDGASGAGREVDRRPGRRRDHPGGLEPGRRPVVAGSGLDQIRGPNVDDREWTGQDLVSEMRSAGKATALDLVPAVRTRVLPAGHAEVEGLVERIELLRGDGSLVVAPSVGEGLVERRVVTQDVVLQAPGIVPPDDLHIPSDAAGLERDRSIAQPPIAPRGTAGTGRATSMVRCRSGGSERTRLPRAARQPPGASKVSSTGRPCRTVDG
jgi:hypothetical protein